MKLLDFSARGARIAAVGLAAGALVVFGYWRVVLQPRGEIARRRFDTLRDLTALYGLEESYKKLNGRYANELDSLLALSPSGAEFKARMGGHLDLSTLAVVGSADRFKLEANVLDGERTLVQLRGPIKDEPTRRRAPPKLVPLAVPDLPGEGKPLDAR